MTKQSYKNEINAHANDLYEYEWMNEWNEKTKPKNQHQRKKNFLKFLKIPKKNIENLLYLYAGVNDKIFEKREFFDTI